MVSVVIYGFAPSTFTRVARMAAIEKGLDHALEGLEFRKPSHGRLHPFLKMPAARVNGTLVFETLAILKALEAEAPSPALFPSSPADAVRDATWTSAACDYLSDTVVGDDIDRDAARAVLAPFDAALDGTPWLSGQLPGAADLFAAPMIAYGTGVAGDLLDEHAHLAGWFGRICARASFREPAV